MTPFTESKQQRAEQPNQALWSGLTLVVLYSVMCGTFVNKTREKLGQATAKCKHTSCHFKRLAEQRARGNVASPKSNLKSRWKGCPFPSSPMMKSHDRLLLKTIGYSRLHCVTSQSCKSYISTCGIIANPICCARLFIWMCWSLFAEVRKSVQMSEWWRTSL